MKRRELGGPVDPRDRAGWTMLSSFATSCRFVLRRRRALRDVVHRRGCLCLGRLDLAHRPAVEGEAVLATLRSAGSAMWRNS